MSEENKSNESNIENIKEQGKQVAKELTNKADELYNKLPLDQINEKLGGKVDVKSKKFKIYAALGGLVAIILLLFTMCDREPRLNVRALAKDANAEQKRMEASLSPEERIDFETAFYILTIKEAKEYLELFEEDEDVEGAKKFLGMSEKERIEFLLKDYDGLTVKEFIKGARRNSTEDEWDDIRAQIALGKIIR